MEELATESRTNAAEYTVSEISGALKRTVEDVFGNVRVRGEISGYRGPHSSGHAYFALKDERAKIDAVVWKGTMARLRFRPEEGMEVIATGKLTTYPGKSSYQIVVDALEPAGAGALMALLEDRKRRLAAEGLFDAGRKQLLPYMPRVIGVVTSPTGAVIRDIVHRIKDRFPLHLIVWPVRVQGETSGNEVAAAVQGFNALPMDGPVARPDLIIVARGGGSLEDLWGFNDEALARVVAASDIPIISAVGHETDWTLIDLVADIRAPTPTGAAEIAVPVKAELEARIAALGARLRSGMSRLSDRRRNDLRAAARALPAADQLLAMPRRQFDEATSRLARALSLGMERKRARLLAVRLTPAALSRRLADAGRTAERDMRRAFSALERVTGQRRSTLSRAVSRLTVEPMARRNKLHRQSIDSLARHADQSVARRLERLRGRLTQADRLLASLKLSDTAILERGYALVTGADGRVVKRAGEIAAAEHLVLTFADGKRDVVATGGPDAKAPQQSEPSLPSAKPSPRAARTPVAGGQGSLF